jgi:hypothetical protein
MFLPNAGDASGKCCREIGQISLMLGSDFCGQGQSRPSGGVSKTHGYVVNLELLGYWKGIIMIHYWNNYKDMENLPFHRWCTYLARWRCAYLPSSIAKGYGISMLSADDQQKVLKWVLSCWLQVVCMFNTKGQALQEFSNPRQGMGYGHGNRTDIYWVCARHPWELLKIGWTVGHDIGPEKIRGDSCWSPNASTFPRRHPHRIWWSKLIVTTILTCVKTNIYSLNMLKSNCCIQPHCQHQRSWGYPNWIEFNLYISNFPQLGPTLRLRMTRLWSFQTFGSAGPADRIWWGFHWIYIDKLFGKHGPWIIW